MSMAIRNADIAHSRHFRNTVLFLVVFAILCSFGFNDVHAASQKPVFENQKAFQLTEEDRNLYNAEYAWCLPTPEDGPQCYVLGSTMSGWLGAGSTDPVENARNYGNGEVGTIKVTALPRKERDEARKQFADSWSN